MEVWISGRAHGVKAKRPGVYLVASEEYDSDKES
jgi:hypothetical protein